MKNVGTMSIGVRAPIISQGDDLVEIVKNSVSDTVSELGLTFEDDDVVAVTESVLARCQGNYATIDQIAKDVRAKLGSDTIGVLFPILSRNRFSMLLKGISKGCKKVVIQLSYPNDEVGNPLISYEQMDGAEVNPYSDSFSKKEFVEKFGQPKHPFTGVDYVEYYESLCENCEIIFSNRPEYILNYTNTVISSDIHTRFRTKQRLSKLGAKVITLDELLNESVDGSGFNPKYGLLGSNLANENSIKLFPRDAQKFVDELAAALKKMSGKNIQVMVYGDGAFKDPAGGIWELADPVCSPAFTQKLDGSPNELKMKYLADTTLKGLDKETQKSKMKQLIKEKGDLKGKLLGQGTTPRHFTDLLASLSDLTSGSGDKGTPIIYIKNYFTNYAD